MYTNSEGGVKWGGIVKKVSNSGPTFRWKMRLYC